MSTPTTDNPEQERAAQECESHYRDDDYSVHVWSSHENTSWPNAISGNTVPILKNWLNRKGVDAPATGGRDSIVAVRMPDDVRAALDDWRRLQPDLPSRSEASRRLVRQAR
jgi:hypothetical protein